MRRALQACVLLLLALVAGWFTRESTLHPALVRVLRWAAPSLGYELELRALHGDWTRELRLEGLRLRALEAGGPLRELRLETVEVRLRGQGLLADLLEGLEHVEAGSGRLELDLPAGETDGDVLELPESLPTAALRALDVVLHIEEGRVELDGLEARLEEEDARTTLLASAEHARLVEGDGVLGAPVALVLSREGRTVRLERLALADEEVVGTLELELPRGEALPVAWRLDLELLEARLGGQGELDGGELSFELTLRDLLLSRVDELLGRLGGSAAPPLDGRVEFHALGTLRLDDPLDASALVELRASDVRVGSRALERLELEGRVAGRRAEVRSGRLVLEGGEVTIDRGGLDLVLPGAGRGRALALGGTAAVEDLGPLGTLLTGAEPDGPRGWSGTASGEVVLEGELPALVGHLRLEGEGVQIEGLPLGRVTIDARADGETVDFAALEVASGALRIAGSGRYLVADGALEGVRLEGELGELERYAPPLASRPAEGGEVAGRLAFEATLEGPLDAPTGHLSATGGRLALFGEPLDDLVLEARLDRGRVSVVPLEFKAPFGAVDAELTSSWAGVAGTGGALDLVVESLSLRASGGSTERELRLLRPARVEREGGHLRVPGIELEGSAGALALDLDVTEETGAVSLGVRGRALEPGAFLAPYLVPGARVGGVDLDVEGTLGGDPGDGVRVRGRVRVARLVPTPEARPLALQIEGALLDRRAELDLFSVDLAASGGRTARRLATLRASVPLDLLGERLLGPGALRVSGDLDLPADLVLRPARTAEGEQPWGGGVVARLDLDGAWDAVTGEVRLDARELTLGALLDPYLVAPSSLSFLARLGDEVRLEALTAELPGRASLSGAGTVHHVLDLASLVRGDLGPWGDATVALEGEFELEDLGWLSRLSESVRRVRGRARGTYVVGGTVARPEPRVALEVAEGAVKLGTAEEFAAVTGKATLDRDGVVVEELWGEFGSAPLVARGSLRFGADPTIEVHANGQGVLLARSSEVRLRGDVDLGLTGPWSELRLAGSVRLRNSVVLRDVDLMSQLMSGLSRGPSLSSAHRGLVLPSFRSAPLATMRLDVAVETADPLRLRSNLARGEAYLDLHLGGTGEVILPTGRIFLEGMVVDLPGGPVRVTSGIVECTRQDPLVPRVEITGETRLAGYDVSLTMTGPYDDLEVVGSSQPPLSTGELYLLILTGRVPEVGTGTVDAAQSIGIYLARDALARWAGGPGEEENIFDHFEILSGREVSQSGVMTMEVYYRWTPLDEERDNLYLVAERDVHEEINMGMRLVFRRR